MVTIKYQIESDASRIVTLFLLPLVALSRVGATEGDVAGSTPSEETRVRLTASHTAYLRVAEGCDHACTFCAIPGFRGKFRSKPFNIALAEATRLVESGVREINLIGVYGTPSNRRALVRLENGRYVRVTVGDTLDGGQVRAISDNALNYVRRGRTITLEIPGG